MDRWANKVAIVTGASSGIGRAIAIDLVKSGLKVIAVARRVELLQKLSKEISKEHGKLYAIQGDITKEESIRKFIEWTETNIGPIEILINNAGMLAKGSLIEGGEEETLKLKQIFDLNVLGLCITTREVIKIMRANKIDGHIVHINSITGHYVPKHIARIYPFYPASKYAVTALTESLRYQLNFLECKIKISSVSPGVTETELTGKVDSRFTKLVPEDLADAVRYVLSTPKHVLVHELIIRPVGEKC